MSKYARATAEEVLTLLSSNGETGLTSSDVNSRRRIHGLNKLDPPPKVPYIFTCISRKLIRLLQEHILLKFLDKFKDPLILLLLGSACLSVLVGQVRFNWQTNYFTS